MGSKVEQTEIKIRGQVIALEGARFSFVVFVESNTFFKYLEKPRPVFGDEISAREAMQNECSHIHELMRGGQ